MAQLLAVDENELIMTASGTESNNMAIKSIAWTFQNRGKHLITTKMEHPSVLNTMAFLEKMVLKLPICQLIKQDMLQ